MNFGNIPTALEFSFHNLRKVMAKRKCQVCNFDSFKQEITINPIIISFGEGSGL